MASFTHYCPFIITDGLDKRGEKKLSCEHGKLTFYEKETMIDFMRKYCGHEYGWKHCSLARSLMQHYEKED